MKIENLAVVAKDKCPLSILAYWNSSGSPSYLAMFQQSIFLLNNFPEAGCQLFSPKIYSMEFFQGPACNTGDNHSIYMSEQLNCARPFFGARARFSFLSLCQSFCDNRI